MIMLIAIDNDYIDIEIIDNDWEETGWRKEEVGGRREEGEGRK